MPAQGDDTENHAIMPYRLVAEKLDAVALGQQKLEVSFAEMRASIMPRHEIVQEVEKRVPMALYLVDKETNSTRIAKLEAAPQSARSWINTLIAAAGCVGSLLFSLISIGVAILVATHVIH